MRNKWLTIVGFIAICAISGTVSAQNLLSNGDFTLDDGVSTLNAADWTEVNTGGWVNREQNANGTYGDPLNFHYAIGNAGAINNYVYQDIPGVAGVSYELTVDAAMDNWWSPSAYVRIVYLDAALIEISTNELKFVANGYDAAVNQPWASRSIAGDAPAGTAWVRAILGSYTPGENGIPGNGGGTTRFDNAVLTAFDSGLDTDGDGLPDFWESNNGLDPFDNGTTNINNGASGDPDIDGLINSAEFAEGTDPQVADTDGDGLNDGDEITNLTDPLDTDTDNDFLTDGDEINTYGTNPLNVDTDSDDVNDATEVYAGSDPNSAASVPANARPDVIGIESFYYNNGVFGSKAGGDLFDYDNTTNVDAYTGHTGASSAWSAIWNTPYITAGRLETRDSAMIRPLNGKATGGEEIALFAQQAISPEVDSQVLYAKVELTLDAGISWGGLSMFGTGDEEMFFGVGDDGSGSNIVFKMEESGVATNYSTIGVTDNQTYTLVVEMDASSGAISLWVDPVLSSPQPAADMIMPSVASTNLRCSAIRLASGGSGAIYWDNLVVGTTWDSLSANSIDSDSDGLPDAWETNYGLDPFDNGTIAITNGASGNPDGDGLVNSDEFANGTDPTLADTDWDGLNDDVELNTSLTDPLVWDTDGDGLNDGDEVNIHGTNPLLTDTDSDGEDDWFEVFQGTDPNDILSTSASEGVAIVDGTLDAAYGDAITVQTVNTSGENNLDELDAAYAYVKNDRLYLMITGNMNTNWNSVEIFIDSSDAVTTNVFTAQGRDNTGLHMDGLVFDAGFSPDYHLYARIGNWAGYTGLSFNLDFADLGADTVSWQDNAFVDLPEGIRYMGPGDATSNIVAIGFNNSNTAGVGSGNVAADQIAAGAVTTGLELSIAMADLGNSFGGEIRILVMATTADHATVSNQLLPGLTPPASALGTTTTLDFSTIPGNQFFTVTLPVSVAPEILSSQLISGGTSLQLYVSKLAKNANYKVQQTPDLKVSFTDMPGSEWTAASENELVDIPVDMGANPVMFYQVVAP